MLRESWLRGLNVKQISIFFLHNTEHPGCLTDDCSATLALSKKQHQTMRDPEKATSCIIHVYIHSIGPFYFNSIAVWLFKCTVGLIVDKCLSNYSYNHTYNQPDLQEIMKKFKPNNFSTLNVSYKGLTKTTFCIDSLTYFAVIYTVWPFCLWNDNFLHAQHLSQISVFIGFFQKYWNSRVTLGFEIK